MRQTASGVILAAAGALLAGCGGSGGSAAAPTATVGATPTPSSVGKPGATVPPRAGSVDLASLNLQVTDMPAGFQAGSEKYYTNEAEAKLGDATLAQYNQHGRIIGDERIFGSSNRSGLVKVDAAVVAYRSTAGAHWELQQLALKTAKNPAFRIVSLGRIGDESMAFTSTVVGKTINASYYVVLFRHGGFRGSVIAAGYAKTTRAEDVAALAGTLNARLAHVATTSEVNPIPPA